MLNIKLFSKLQKSTEENSQKSEESPRTPRSPFSLSLSFRKRISKKDINEDGPTQEKKKVSSFFGVIDVKEDHYLESENELVKLSSKFSQTLKREKTKKLSDHELKLQEEEEEDEDETEIVEITSDGEDDEHFKIPQISIESEKSSKEKMEEMIYTVQKRKTRALSIMNKYESTRNFGEKQNTNENEKKLFEHIKNNDMKEFQLLISSNCSTMDLDWKNPDLDSITLLHAAIFSNNLQAAEILIENQVNIEILDNRERTPLHISSYLGRIEIIAILLSNGAKVNVKDGFGNAPLHILMKSHHFDLFDALVLSGCDLNFKTSSGKNIHLLTLKGATLIHDSISSNDNILLEFLLLASENSADISLNSRDRLGFTPLLKSIASGNLFAIELLLNNEKIDKNVVTMNGHNMFHLASGSSQPSIISKLMDYFSDDEEKLKFLLNQSDVLKQKNTPIHLCIKSKNLTMLKEYLKWKDFIQWNKTNQSGKTPFSMSQEMNEIELINLLKKNGIKK
jgi:ankyrin repeat protein